MYSNFYYQKSSINKLITQPVRRSCAQCGTRSSRIRRHWSHSSSRRSCLKSNSPPSRSSPRKMVAVYMYMLCTCIVHFIHLLYTLYIHCTLSISILYCIHLLYTIYLYFTHYTSIVHPPALEPFIVEEILSEEQLADLEELAAQNGLMSRRVFILNSILNEILGDRTLRPDFLKISVISYQCLQNLAAIFQSPFRRINSPLSRTSLRETMFLYHP